jgi:hypothetical protein
VRRIRGRRYGGSSSWNDEGAPASRVRDRIRAMKNVAATPTSEIATRLRTAASRPKPGGAAAETKMLATRIRMGQRPLQGTRLFVRVAMSRSRGESMMRVATTAAALQPNPIAMVSACLPWAPTRSKRRSSRKATRGR